jgi:hypothetical protein
MPTIILQPCVPADSHVAHGSLRSCSWMRPPRESAPLPTLVPSARSARLPLGKNAFEINVGSEKADVSVPFEHS